MINKIQLKFGGNMSYKRKKYRWKIKVLLNVAKAYLNKRSRIYTAEGISQ